MSTDPGAPGQVDWDYATLRDLLTIERLGSYFRASSGDTTGALRLYEWNMTASAAVMLTTGMVEVVVRNALDAELRAWATHRGASWFDVAPLDKRGLSDVIKARQRGSNRGRLPEVPGKVVAELSLGFWRYLVARRYLTTLWVPALHRAFPHGHPDLQRRRSEVERHLSDLMLLRNRAAHHEPIHRRDLLADLATAIETAQWVDPTAGAWVKARSTLSEVLARRP